MRQRLIRIVGAVALALALASALPCAAAAPAREIPIADFVRSPSYSGVKLSPDGAHLAMVVERGEKNVLAVLRTADLGVVSVTELPGKYSVGAFAWGSSKRLVFDAFIKRGRFVTDSLPFGLLYAVDIDGSKPRQLMDSPKTGIARGSMSSWTDREGVYRIIDPLRDDDARILIEVMNPMLGGRNFVRVGTIDIVSARIKILAAPPREGCDIAIDHRKQPRFASCVPEDENDPARDDGATELFRRDDDGRWTRIGGYGKGAHALDVVGAAADGRVYAAREDGEGTRAFGLLDPATGAFSSLFRDPVSDPAGFLRTTRGDAVFGVVTAAGKPKITLLDESHEDAALYASLAAAFPDQLVEFLDASRDGALVVFSVRNDRNPGELYLYDRGSGKARFLMRRMQWIEPARMASVRPFRIRSRDGIDLHGYLTVPNGSDGRNLPTIVNVHGGPMGVRDDWGFNAENQLLASRGYLVLQVNFRGSGGFGRRFERMAYGEWHDDIIDDIVDATRWAIDQGHADRDRICIYGGSFGGYAAMMAPAKEQNLFKCAFGYVGAYDAEIQMQDSDTALYDAGRRYLARALGATRAERAAASPVHHADRIRIPVYLVAGAADQRCPPQNTEAMRDALVAAGNPPEGVIVQEGEGHGFYKEENNLRLYTEMLAFFSRHIGPGP